MPTSTRSRLPTGETHAEWSATPDQEPKPPRSKQVSTGSLSRQQHLNGPSHNRSGIWQPSFVAGLLRKATMANTAAPAKTGRKEREYECQEGQRPS